MKSSSFIFRCVHPGVWGAYAVAVLVGVGIFWLAHRAAAQSPDHAVAPPPVVAGVARVARCDLCQQITVAAEFRPYVEVRLNAKVSGYVSQMNVDFGDQVKAGQLLATIEVPELQAQLVNALAVAAKAGADYTNANLIYQRLVSVNRDHPNLVAQQDLDTAAGQ